MKTDKKTDKKNGIKIVPGSVAIEKWGENTDAESFLQSFADTNISPEERDELLHIINELTITQSSLGNNESDEKDKRSL